MKDEKLNIKKPKIAGIVGGLRFKTKRDIDAYLNRTASRLPIIADMNYPKPKTKETK